MMPMKLMTAFSNLRNKSQESSGHRAETIHHQTCWWAGESSKAQWFEMSSFHLEVVWYFIYRDL